VKWLIKSPIKVLFIKLPTIGDDGQLWAPIGERKIDSLPRMPPIAILFLKLPSTGHDGQHKGLTYMDCLMD
jgi:hypothetical protein